MLAKGDYGSLRAEGKQFGFFIKGLMKLDSFITKASYSQSPKMDSYISYIGKKHEGYFIGAAVSNEYRLSLEDSNSGKVGWLWLVSPSTGIVKSDSVKLTLSEVGTKQISKATAENRFSGIDGSIGYRFTGSDGLTYGPRYNISVLGYEEDYSGFDINIITRKPGGYFSPKMFINQQTQFWLSLDLPQDISWDLVAGPSLQIVSNSSVNNKVILGVEGQSRFFIHNLFQTIDFFGGIHCLKLPDAGLQFGANLGVFVSF